MIKAKAKLQIPARSKRNKSSEPAGSVKRQVSHKRSKAKPSTEPVEKRRTPAQHSGRGGSKQAQVLAMLQTPHGVTIEKIAALTGWQHHSVRGFFAAVIRKRLGLDLIWEASVKGRVYRIVDRPTPAGGIETNKPV